jgi:multisubunit Na+/H+ antiporter MnhG subunit
MLGQGGKGTYIIGLYIGLVIVTIPCTSVGIGLLLWPVLLAIWVLAGFDAYTVAKAVEDGETVDENEYKVELLFKVMSNLHKDAIFNG